MLWFSGSSVPDHNCLKRLFTQAFLTLNDIVMSLRYILFVLFFSLLAFEQGIAQQSANSAGYGELHFSNEEGQLPMLNKPTYLPDDEGLMFSWEHSHFEVPVGALIGYEIKIYELKPYESVSSAVVRKPVFVGTSGDSRFVYKPEFAPLYPGGDYLTVVFTRLTYPDKTEIIDGTPNGMRFTYVPICAAPAKLNISSIGTNNFTVSWSGMAAKPKGYQYEVRYKTRDDGKAAWVTKLVTEGASLDITGLTPSEIYQVEVRRICPQTLQIPELYSEWTVKEVKLPAEKAIQLPPFICGDSYTIPTCGEIKRDGSFDTIFVGGFPVEVIHTSCNGTTWTGTGYLPLPFGNTIVKVEWENVQIDVHGTVCSGAIRGISDDLSYYPDLDPGPIAFGGEICIPPPSAPGFDTNGIHSVTGLPWDEHGFGPNGTYDQEPPYPGYQPGGPIDTSGIWDPWGFDADGNSIETGTNVNELGCTQEQYLSLLEDPPAYQPAPCNELPDPYFWVDTTGAPPTAPGLELASEVGDSLEIWLGQVLDELQTFYQDSVDIQAAVCDGIRTTMNSQLATLGYERKYVLGPLDEYFNPGMSERFTSKPQPMVTTMDRNPLQVEFEAKHIELYACDVKWSAYKGYFDIIDSLRNEGLSAFAEEVLDKIKQFDAEDAAYYKVRENLIEWIRQQSIENINNVYEDSYGYQPMEDEKEDSRLALRSKKAKTSASPSNNNYPGNFLAANDLDGSISDALWQSFNTTPEDVSFQFQQGWREINGTHRAYFLDAIAQQRQLAEYMPNMVTAHDSTLMPIIVKNRASDGRLYQVYLDSLVFTPAGAAMNAYLVLELPHNGQRIVFEAHGINFGPTGFPSMPISPVRLTLGNDVAVRLNNAARLIVKGGPNTYISIDCGGFAGIGIEADVELCRNIVKPLDTAGNIEDDPERVSGHFQVFVPTWGEFYLSLSMDDFVVTNVEDIKWSIDSVIFDHSETISPPTPLVPPAGYSSQFADANGFQPEWEGFFIQNLSATLPNHFNQGGQPTTVSVQKVVIDQTGFSGGIMVTPLLSLGDGNAGGWAFSVDTFKVSIAHNTLVDAKFNGLVNVPIFKGASSCGGSSNAPIVAADCFKYNAFIQPGGIYNFTVKTNGNYCVDMWKAGSVQIDTSSSIEMKLENGQFSAIATLNGNINISADIGNGMSIEAPNITFQGVEVSNQAPYFSPGNWGFPSVSADFGGFELTVNGLHMVETEEGDPALGFAARLKLANAGAVDVTAQGAFKIVGEMVEVNGRQRWKFKEIKVEQICLEDVSFPGVDKLSGCIMFYENNPTYGSGFRGQVDVKFTSIGQVKAVAQFGKVNSKKYFFVDALFCSESGIQMGPVTLYGIGGGIYKNMTRPESGAGLGGLCGPNASIPTTIGSSISGITYTPTTEEKFGLKLTVVLGAAKKEAFNANVTFEVTFNGGNGLSNAYMYGNAKLMDEINLQGAPVRKTDGTAPITAQVCANVDMNMNFETKTFSGSFEVFMNVADIMRGSGANNRLVQAGVLFSPNTWYIKCGRPIEGQRAGTKISIPGLGNIAEFGSYLQIGQGVDPMPPLPADIQALTGLNNTGNFQNQLTGALASQRQSTLNGFVFGADIELGDTNKEFGIFKATLNAKVGFDVSMLNYPGITCANTNSALGINGWYANGQIYAKLAVGLGVKVKVFGKNNEFDIFNMTAAAAMQAGLPNPFWAKGGVGANYNLLNGLVQGHCDFQISIGEQCDAQGVGNPFEIVPIISTTTPQENEEVMFNKKPFVNFNFPLETNFNLPDFDGNNHYYKILVDHVRIKMGDWPVPLHYVFNGPKDGMRIEPHIFLPKNTNFTMEIKVHVDSSGVNIYQEERIVNFKTNGSSLNGILPENVAGSYPLNGQYNFYKGELNSGIGYIQLKLGQPDAFVLQANYQLMVRFRKSSGECIIKPASYDALNYKVTFDLPTKANFFEANGIYRMDLLKVPMNGNSYAVDPCAANSSSNSNTSSSSSSNQGPGNGPPIPPNTPSSQPPPIHNMYTAYFRVSQYNKFYDKITAWASSHTHEGQFKFKTNAGFEPFDKFEVSAVNGMPPLVEFTALTLPSSGDWFNGTSVKGYYELANAVADPLYTGFDFFKIDNRDPSVYRFPAMKAIYFTDDGPSIDEEDFENGSINIGFSPQSIKYDIPGTVAADITEIKQDLNLYFDTEMMMLFNSLMQEMGGNDCPSPCSCYSSSMEYPLLDMFPWELLDCWCNPTPAQASGNFPVLFQYKLPGLGITSSEKKVTLVKP
jgi:hypothetical protein